MVELTRSARRCAQYLSRPHFPRTVRVANFVFSGPAAITYKSRVAFARHGLEQSPALTIVLKDADAELDYLVSIWIRAGRFHIDNGATSLGVSSGGWYSSCDPQPAGDTIISTLGQQPGHLFECGFHVADIAKFTAAFNSWAARFSPYRQVALALSSHQLHSSDGRTRDRNWLP